MTEKRKVPTRAEILGLTSRVKIVKTKKRREKSASEKYASLSKKIQNLKARAKRANEAAGKANAKLAEAEEELREFCPHKGTLVGPNMRGDEIAADLDIKPTLYKWCTVCGANLGQVVRK